MSDQDKKFEEWYANFAKSAYDEPDVSRSPNGEYRDPNVLRSFEAWKAALSSLEVVLPARIEPVSESDYWTGAKNGFNQCLDSCRAYLKHAGVRVKE